MAVGKGPMYDPTRKRYQPHRYRSHGVVHIGRGDPEPAHGVLRRPVVPHLRAVRRLLTIVERAVPVPDTGQTIWIEWSVLRGRGRLIDACITNRLDDRTLIHAQL